MKSLGNLRVNRRIILKHMLKTVCEDVDYILLLQDRVQLRGSCEHSNTPPVSIKGEKFIH
jgi:hypothetical protein